MNTNRTQPRLPLKFAKRRPLQILADARMTCIDGVAPSSGIFLINELSDRNFGEIGITHEVGTIVKCAPESFGLEMNVLSGTVAVFREVEAFQNVQDFNQRHSSRRWWRSADNFVPRIAPADGHAFSHFVRGQIFGSYQASTFLNLLGQFAGHGPVVERVGILSKAFQSPGQFRLFEDLARLIVVSIAQENALRFRKLREVLIIFEILRILVGEGKTVAGKLDRWSHYFFYTQLAILFFCINEARHSSGNPDGFITHAARSRTGPWNDVALGIEKHVFVSRGRRFFAEV